MDHDFIIIGGGIAGVSLAARLAPFGSVLLLEGEGALAHHASGRSAALYEPHYGLAPVVALSLASGAYFHAQPAVLSPRGMMMVAKADARALFEADAAGMNLTVVSLDDARAMVPILNADVVAHVAVADHAWDIDTDLLLQGFAKTARSHGAQILTAAPVTAVVRLATGWRVTSAQGEFSARVVINAAGPWADTVASMAGVAPLGFTPLRRSMARIPAPGGHDVSRWPMIFGAGETWYAKPDAGALIVSPAEEEHCAPHDAFADDMVLAEGLARYEEMVTEPVTRMLANWAGLRTFSPDRVPVIGFDVAQPGFFWLAGQGGYGFQSAPAASKMAADLVLGQATGLDAGLVAALSPARFGV
ncbi:Glycine/D-amino acid oxidase [Pseudorhodobacter antarcticus]|uniref:Glycine/D-amino acid oxidase n=1 Tax=Pseudorhodobacter antarcticus TaxID=1077947 RepID=A0A1H8CIH6_9RHOB|nr:FAD-binding oxidoreductase [Pseudorhodobacter antarcticus]SEM94845.1 Glycine/D-amino acid oxidase [Pseudorhodobacter antarcticus]